LTKAEAQEISPFTVRSSGKHHKTEVVMEKEDEKQNKRTLVKEVKAGKEKSPIWTTEGIVQRSLEPSVTHSEHKEYKRYIKHELKAKGEEPTLIILDIPNNSKTLRN
jgi:hypothetical protein